MSYTPKTELGKKLVEIRNRAINERAEEKKRKKKLRLVIEIEYDPELMHGNDPGAVEWFRSTMINGDLVLHSNDIGDEIGPLRVIRIIQEKKGQK